MEQADLDRLVERWANDADFRSRMRADPEGAVRTEGIELDEEALAALRSIDWTEADEELEARISRVHGSVGGC